MLAAGITLSYAQCDKNVSFISSKTDQLNASGAVSRTVDESTGVILTKTDITVTINGDHTMTGTIKSAACNWKTPYKDGITALKVLMNENGEEKNVNITTEGKNNKVTLLFDMEGEPEDRVRVTADKFEEKKC